MTTSTFIIAEIGVNHDGSIERALELVDVAAAAGADAVKFQSFTADRLASEDAPTASYQQQRDGADSQIKMLARLELSVKEFGAIKHHCDGLGIEFMSTAFDADWLRELVALGIKRIKWPSGEINNLPFLKEAASFDLPIYLSTGMATIAEISAAVEVIRDARQRRTDDDLVVLHCTSLYPAPIDTLNLSAIRTLATEFGLPVGYSDHSVGVFAAPLAVALGACVIEKHFTYDRRARGPDHHASLTGPELAALVAAIREAEVALGHDSKQPSNSELEMARVARKSLCLAHDMNAGEELTPACLVAKRPGDGIAPSESHRVIGKSVVHDLRANHRLTWSDLS